jgi:SulP family sulfate permease
MKAKPTEGVLNPLRRGGFMRTIGEENVFASKAEAIASIVPRLDPDVCARCTRRIFLECAAMPGAPRQAEAAPATGL